MTITYAHLTESWGDPIDPSPLAESVTDRDLVQVDEGARLQARFRWPVALDPDVNRLCVLWDGDAAVEAERLEALLRAAYLALVSAQSGAGAPVPFAFECAVQYGYFGCAAQLLITFGHRRGEPVVVIAEQECLLVDMDW